MVRMAAYAPNRAVARLGVRPASACDLIDREQTGPASGNGGGAFVCLHAAYMALCGVDLRASLRLRRPSLLPLELVCRESQQKERPLSFHTEGPCEPLPNAYIVPT